MARRFKPQRRQVKPDPQYGNKQVSMFVNRMMKDGKKSVALKIMYTAFGLMEKKAGKDPVEMFLQALGNVSPTVEVKPRRVGGATYQVPVEVKDSRRAALSIRWMIQNAKSRSGKSMSEKLTGEIIDAYNNVGGTIKKKEDVHRMAEANKAFAHYRW